MKARSLSGGERTKLDRARSFYESGHTDRAIRLCRELIDSDTDDFHALHFLGTIEAEQGRFENARSLMERSLSIRPPNLQFFENFALLLLRLNDSPAVLRACEQGLRVKHSFRLLHAEAVALYRLNRFNESLATLDRILADHPNEAGSLYLRGCALAQLARYEEALASFDRTLRVNANSADAWCGRGNVLQDLKRFDESAEAYDKAIALQPDHLNAWLGRGNLQLLMHSYDQACLAYERALAREPRLVAAWNGLGVALGALQRYNQALVAVERALALNPASAATWLQRGLMLEKLNRLEEARAAWRRAGEIDAELPGLRGFRLRADLNVCDWSNYAVESSRLSRDIGAGDGFSPWTFMVISGSPQDQLSCARNWVSKNYPLNRQPVWRGERYAHDRIRLAYVSSDFREHPVAYLAAGLFAAHDRSRFETIAISLGPDDASLTRARLRNTFERFVDVQGMEDREIALLMRRLEVDIAVDLNGFTDGCRPSVFAQRPAPVQVNFLGYAGTLGQACWDYIIADRFVIPDEARRHYAENVAYLPDCCVVNDDHRLISDRPVSRADAGLPEDSIVFCCFNKVIKFTPDIFGLWMRVLGAVENSVLWLSASDPVAIANLRREANARGIDPDRLIVAARVPSNADHLARLRLADLFLDTLHYNAHSTAADALWARLPVLTCTGETFASRVAASMLRSVGLPELVTTSLADYETLALALARDPARLAALRSRLARNIGVEPLFDTRRFTRHIEVAFTTMWNRAQSGQPPSSFAVDC